MSLKKLNNQVKPSKTRAICGLSVNGEDVQVLIEASKTLLEVLREDLGLTGTKHGCELGECGACTVLCDGRPVMSCLVLALECEGVKTETIEGMARDGQLHPLQQAFAEHGGSQCGYCTPGMLMTAQALLANVQLGEAIPDRAEIREALSGNLCRCTGYQQIVESVEAAAVVINESGAKAAGSES
jgi:carbon-monoxide dehydrogenase small subunit